MAGLYEIKSLMSKISGGMLTEAILMEATRDEIYTQYYDEHNGKVKKIPREVFDLLCEIGDVDNNSQKMSEFAKWLCDGYRRTGITTSIYDKSMAYIIARRNGLKKDFATFRKIQKIKPEGIDLNLRNYSLASFIEKMAYVRENGLDYSQKDIKKLGSDVVYQDDTWKVILIKSRDASLYYGRGTTWCTSSTESSMYFNDYMNKGLLFIFINTTNNAKYQGFYSFDYEWDEFKDPENHTVYPEDIFSKEMFDYITNKANGLIDERIATVWENEAEIVMEPVINDTFKVFKVSRLERYRVKNMKTDEFLTLSKTQTFTGVHFNEKYKILFLEINYGSSWGVVYINGDNAEIIEPNIRWYTISSLDLYDEKHKYVGNDETEFIIFKYGKGRYKIFNAEKRTFVKINGKEDFLEAYTSGAVLCVMMFNGKNVLFSLKEKQPVLLNGEMYFDKVSYKGYGMMLIQSKNNCYLYNNGFDSFLPIPDADSVYFEHGFIAIRVGDNYESPQYRIYIRYYDEILKVGDIDLFDEYHLVLPDLLSLHSYSNEGTINYWLFNFKTNSFCDSNDVPCYETDIEAFYDNIVMFWNNNDVLTGYHISENKILPLPVTIDYDSVKNTSKRKCAMGEKYQSMIMFFVDDDDENIAAVTLRNDSRTIIHRDNKDEKPKVYYY